mmetsp:Transcript_27437/g.38276  ORF Transcript_27437/g.38276 Transcript_27437/m.38276 type:complete len:241 (+) Transcript_27437:131-853(+)
MYRSARSAALILLGSTRSFRSSFKLKDPIRLRSLSISDHDDDDDDDSMSFINVSSLAIDSNNSVLWDSNMSSRLFFNSLFSCSVAFRKQQTGTDIYRRRGEHRCDISSSSLLIKQSFLPSTVDAANTSSSLPCTSGKTVISSSPFSVTPTCCSRRTCTNPGSSTGCLRLQEQKLDFGKVISCFPSMISSTSSFSVSSSSPSPFFFLLLFIEDFTIIPAGTHSKVASVELNDTVDDCKCCC